ncbi:exonuclease 1 isoform X2 [Sipha flava]|uniref:Exonuclease 1 n=1 Tax=Sipha flava TaxID=143950 RepID=A0A8B8FLL1_9HEMI|nr:exonuclease 1 isoform X2 [Sipha flava]
MGIQGLIPLLEKSWRSVNVSEFSECTVAIDAYCWLHKGVYTCAEKLAKGEDSQAYVHYCMRFVSMLLAKNIKPILVFDGQQLPAKAETESKRRKLREQNRKKAAELMRLDKGKEASSLLRRSIDVTHKMALNLIKRCREINVDCIVAPYEADSQLAYLNLSGIAHLVITEDSDLLLFGCKRVLFKLDQNGGGILIEQEKIHLSMNMQPEQFNMDKFRYMCILSGCDYLPSIPGIGLMKARQFISRSSEPDIYKNLSRLGSFMNVKIPSDYRDQFMDADRMFQYQPVYDPLTRQIIPLNKIIDPNLSTLVSKLTNDQAYQLALGNIDPISLEVMDDWDPDTQMTPASTTKSKVIKARHKSIWSKNYIITEFKPNMYSLNQEIIKSSPIVHSKFPKNGSYASNSSPSNELSSIKKCLPVTEDDILNTLEEIYENETYDQDEPRPKNSMSKKDKNVVEKILVSEIDNVTAEKEEFPSSKQLTKRKHTVIDSEKQIVSGYFSTEVPKSYEEKCINPFKCRKITSPKKENTKDDLNTSFNYNYINEENKPQLFENEKITKIDINSFKKTPSRVEKAFSWKNFSHNKSVTNNDESQYQKIDNEDDIDEGFFSQNANTSSSKVTPKQRKRSCPRTGLSKSTGKGSQTLLSKFGFKMGEQLKR